MMRKGSDIKDVIERLNKLQALQIKATDKLNKITEDAAGKPPKKKKTKQAGKNKAKTTVKKDTFWKRLFGKKTKKVKKKQIQKSKE